MNSYFNSASFNKDELEASLKSLPECERADTYGLMLIEAQKHHCTSQALGLIQAGANVRIKDTFEGMTILHYAASNGDRKVIRALVATGKCDFLIQDKRGRYAFELAGTYGGDFAIERLLLKHQLRQAIERSVSAWLPPNQEARKPAPQR